MKVLEKFLTRDAPLIAIECWYKGRMKNFKDFFEISFPRTLFLSSNRAFEFYTDLKDFDNRLPKKLAKWLKNKAHQRKVYSVHGYMKEGLDYFKKIKIAKNTSTKELLNQLNKVRYLFTRGFLGILVTHHFPRWHDEFKERGKILFSQNLAKEIMKWREAEGNIFFNEGVNTFYFLLKKIAKREKWNPDLLKYLTYQELVKSLKIGKSPWKRTGKRKNSIFAYFNYKVLSGNPIDKELKKFDYRLKKEEAPESSKFVRGTTANHGYGRGKVRVIFSREQLSKFEKGEILIAPMTSPWYLPAMKKAVAFVTDEGGITCHAAMVARELKKPCIIGTKIATQVFKDGDLVEVDAEQGIVRRLK